MTEVVIAAIKDGASERPIPTAWRPALRRVVDAFVRGDYAVVDGVDDIESISEETAGHIQWSIYTPRSRGRAIWS